MDYIKLILIGVLIVAALYTIIVFGAFEAAFEKMNNKPAPAPAPAPAPSSAVRMASGDLELTETKHLDEILTGARGKAAVFVYSPSCPHCVHVKPIIEGLGMYRYNTAKLATREQLTRWSIRGVPMILAWDSQGRVRQHLGDRSADAIRAFLQSL